MAEQDKKRKQQADDEYEEHGYFTLRDGTLSKDLSPPAQENPDPRSHSKKAAPKSSTKKRISSKSTQTQDAVLHYFDLIGRAETTRMILTYYNTKFTDNRIAMEDWSDFKSTKSLDFGQLPCLEIDGLRLVQSVAINQYLCRKFGAEARTNEDKYRVESLVMFKEDVQAVLFTMAWNKKTEEMEEWYSNTAPGILEMLENRLCQNLDGEHFFVNRRETLADFTWFEFAYDWFLRPSYAKYEPILQKNAPKFRALIDRILEKNEHLRDYLASRTEIWF